MPQGISVAIGLNSVDPKHYSGWSGDLSACEADAEDMAAIANSRSFKSQILLTKNATRAKVVSAISGAAKKLKSGDIFMLSYSGHGGQVPDVDGEEDDNMDETWCLYDGEILDDELNALYATFAAGVRILLFSDSCHSGTVAKAAFLNGTSSAPKTSANPSGVVYRAMPNDIARRVYRDHQKFYNGLQTKVKKAKSATVKASVLLISGCQDNQLSADGTFNGLFTGNLLRVWSNGQFKGNYTDFHKAILRLMPPQQSPNLFRDGSLNATFESQIPFTV